MTEFKIGDKVKVKEGSYIGYTPGSSYNLPRTPGIVVESGGYIIVDYDGKRSPPVNPNAFDLVSTPIPLYSEEQAVSFLREKGYKVEEPPKPLKGQVIVYRSIVYIGRIFTVRKETWDVWSDIMKVGCTIIAIVDWTEGQGI